VSIIDRLQSFDRRWIFLAMGLAIVIPLLVPLGLPARTSPSAKALYYAVDGIPDGSTVFVSMDLEPASTPELEPYFRALVAHLKKKNCKIVFASTWYNAPPLVERWLRDSVDVAMFEGDRPYRRNEDYVWLGFREGKEAAISAFGQDLWNAYGGRAADGARIDSIPMMQGYRRLADFPLVALVSAGHPGAKEYVQYVQTRYKIPMVAACTAVSTTDLYPYYASGQLMGLAGGLSDTARYEVMVMARIEGKATDVGRLGLGEKGLDVLNVGHLVVILAIVFGNVVFLLGWLKRRRA
jgi:hypothetical protein